MSTNVNPQQPLEVVLHCPVALPEAAAPVIDPKEMRAMLDQQQTAHRRPNPANGAPMPKNHRFFA